MNDFFQKWVYTDEVKEHFINPKNIWKRDEEFTPDGVGEVGSLACGDQMRIGIQVKDNIIADIRWLTYGCASAIASTSVMSEMVKGMTIEEAYKLTPKQITEELGGLPEHKFHCSVLGDKGLRSAIDDYLQKNDLPNTLKHEVAVVVCECNNVTDQTIEELVKTDQAENLDELQKLTNYGTKCGKCKDQVKDLFNEYRHMYGK